MEDLLATVGAQAWKYAVRSGIALTSKYAMRQCSRLIETVDDCEMHSRLLSLQKQFDSKIMVIAPTIDLVEFKSGRGNVFLDSALPLTKALHGDIVCLGRRIDKIASFLEIKSQHGSYPQRQSNIANLDIRSVVADIASMLDRIDREIPLLQLAITASGESLSSSLPPSISPSRLLQASTLLIVGDMQFHSDQPHPVQIGPSFCLSLYMLFLGHAPVAQVRAPTPSPGDTHGQNHGNDSQKSYGLGPEDRKPIWQEVIHKARVTLHRTKALAEYSYHLEFTEDLDDGRLRDKAEACTQIRQQIAIHQISKIFYTDSGRLLNIGDDTADGKNPVLLFKRDPNAQPLGDEHKHVESYLDPTPGHAPASFDNDAGDQVALDQQLYDELRRSTNTCHAAPREEQTRQVHGFPKHVDPEWIALEMYEDTAEEHETPQRGSSTQDAAESWDEEAGARSHVCVTEAAEAQQKSHKLSIDQDSSTMSTAQRSPLSNVTTSLSLIEMLVRLAGLQEFQQTSHLSIPDHILTFFLEESSTAGLGGEAQWAARQAAKARVGFDPYLDSSPRKQNNV